MMWGGGGGRAELLGKRRGVDCSTCVAIAVQPVHNSTLESGRGSLYRLRRLPKPEG